MLDGDHKICLNENMEQRGLSKVQKLNELQLSFWPYDAKLAAACSSKNEFKIETPLAATQNTEAYQAVGPEQVALQILGPAADQSTWADQMIGGTSDLEGSLMLHLGMQRLLGQEEAGMTAHK